MTKNITFERAKEMAQHYGRDLSEEDYEDFKAFSEGIRKKSIKVAQEIINETRLILNKRKVNQAELPEVLLKAIYGTLLLFFNYTEITNKNLVNQVGTILKNMIENCVQNKLLEMNAEKKKENDGD